MSSTLFLADNSASDNTIKPVAFESDEGEEVVFAISQSRSQSKVEGQDAIATSIRGKWECCVLCDGHDLHGHLVARAICEMLSSVLLDRLEKCALDSEDAEMAIIDAFTECEERVMWSNAMLQPNSFVRVVQGEWEGRVGYVSEVHDEDDTFSIIVVDSDAYHRPRLPRSCLTGSRYVGGSTCVAFIRDSVANLVRVAVMGDTRALVLGVNNPSLHGCFEQDPIWERVTKNAYLTFPHDVFNTAELARLKEQFSGDYEIDGPYLINPLTGCEIQPTRGFGDFDMYGTGYISIPDVSNAFPLHPGVVVLVASDGIFDDNVWDDFSVVADFLSNTQAKGGDLELLANSLHMETVKRSKRGGYVDDISFFMCRHVPATSSPTNAEKRGLPQHHGGIPRPPTRSMMAESGVDDLPTPGSSFISCSSFIQMPRESASLSEIAVSRRISQRLNSNATGGDAAHEMGYSAAGGHMLTSTAAQRLKKRSSTADFIDPNMPRYLKDKRSESTSATTAAKGDETVRRTRGPSFMLPDGFDIFSEEEGGDLVALDLAVIGEDKLFIDDKNVVSPADHVRTVIAAKKRGSTVPDLGARGSLIQIIQPRPSVNAVLQRMAARYGHDPRLLEDLVRDLSVV